MDWRRFELGKAGQGHRTCGGVLTAAACVLGDEAIPCGNANGDPCICGRPQASAEEATLCSEEQACQAQGGTFELYGSAYLEDGGTPPPACVLGAVYGEPDASPDDATAGSEASVDASTASQVDAPADSALDASTEDAPSDALSADAAGA